jgi:hypothetical protein
MFHERVISMGMRVVCIGIMRLLMKEDEISGRQERLSAESDLAGASRLKSRSLGGKERQTRFRHIAHLQAISKRILCILLFFTAAFLKGSVCLLQCGMHRGAAVCQLHITKS